MNFSFYLITINKSKKVKYIIQSRLRIKDLLEYNYSSFIL